MLLFEALVSGLAAGILMGLVSHAGFRAGIFRSSLLIIDGTFALQMLGLRYSGNLSVLVGIPVHIFTSISFGAGYAVLINMLQLDPRNGWFIALYIFMLWVSMLFIALPVAGHGYLGRRLGKITWFEQLILHIVFGIGLSGALYFFH
jgi:hypothetical protein